LNNTCYPIKKAKGLFLYDIHSNKYYDLQSNSNILGHSNKKITTIVKNHISSTWNIKSNSVYHKRLVKLINNIFGNRYGLFFCHSLSEFMLRINNYVVKNNSGIDIYYDRFKDWLFFNKIEMNKDDKISINVYDAAQIYLDCKGGTQLFKEKLNEIKNDKICILNYFWYPDINIDPNNADIIILPEIFSGNFDYVLILIKNDSILSKDQKYFCNEITKAPSLYAASSLKYYHEISKTKQDLIQLNYKGFTQSGRLFSYNDIQNYASILETFKNNGVLLNSEPPYYSYLPLILEDYQKKFLKRIKL